MISLKQKSKGFTIVELLIVIVVIAILATLVIVTFTGIQQKARDSKRQTDIDAVDSHLEAFYASNGYYPTLAALQDPSWVSSNMKGLDESALADPKVPSNDVSATQTGIKGAADASHYGYNTSAGSNTCTGSTETDQCTGFSLTADLEAGGTFSKSSNTSGS